MGRTPLARQLVPFSSISISIVVDYEKTRTASSRLSKQNYVQSAETLLLSTETETVGASGSVGAAGLARLQSPRRVRPPTLQNSH